MVLFRTRPCMPLLLLLVSVPEAAQNPLLNGPSKLPEKCEFPKGADSTLIAKFEELGMSRADLVFGAADPVVEPEPPPIVVAEPLPLAVEGAEEAPSASEQPASTAMAVAADATAEAQHAEVPEAGGARVENSSSTHEAEGPSEAQEAKPAQQAEATPVQQAEATPNVAEEPEGTGTAGGGSQPEGSQPGS